MTRSENIKRVAKSSLLYLGLAVAVVLALPLLAGLAYTVRLLIPLLIVAALVAVAVSPGFRRWFVEEGDNAAAYHGVTFPTASLLVHPAHSWARIERPGAASVGVDALAVMALGEIGSVEAPAPGTRVEQGQTLFRLVRGGRRLEVAAPVGGVVAGVNPEATARPGLIKDSPYGAGWVVRLEGSDEKRARDPLLRGTSLRRSFKGEVDRLTMMLAPAGCVPTMADGGELAGDLSGNIDELQWAEIVDAFFTGKGG